MELTKTQIAIHESGHVIASFKLNRRFEFVTIKESEGVLGFVKYSKTEMNEVLEIIKKQRFESLTEEEERLIEDQNIIEFAGFYAEKKYTGNKNHEGSSHDRTNSIIAAESMFGSITELEDYLNMIGEKTEKLVVEDWKLIRRFAEYLVEKETLTYEQSKIIYESLSLNR